MGVNIVEIKNGDVVIVNDTSSEYPSFDRVRDVLDTIGQASTESCITYLYGNYDVTVIRKVQ